MTSHGKALLDQLLNGLDGNAAPATDRVVTINGKRLKSSPWAAIWCCPDQPVSPENLFGARDGELFVLQTPPVLPSFEVSAAVEHAISSLAVPLVIVLGHEGCGLEKCRFDREFAVQAADELRWSHQGSADVAIIAAYLGASNVIEYCAPGR